MTRKVGKRYERANDGAQAANSAGSMRKSCVRSDGDGSEGPRFVGEVRTWRNR